MHTRRRALGVLMTVLGVVVALGASRLLSKPPVGLERVAGAGAAAAIGGPPQPLRDTVTAAAVIWRGTVGAVSAGSKSVISVGERQWPARLDRAAFHVERVIKGPPASGVKTITFCWTPRGPYSGALLAQGQHGILFLDEKAQTVDPRRPILLLGADGAEGTPGQEPFDAVTQEMLFSLREDVSPGVVNALILELVEWLHVGFDQMSPVLTRLATSDDDRIAAEGLWGLTLYEDPDGVAGLVQLAIAHASDPQHPVHGVIFAVRDLRDPSLASLIDPLLDTDVPEWRQCAIEALRKMRSRDHIHRFAAALDEEDPWTQFLAMRALGEILDKRPHSEWMTHYLRFREDPGKYTSKWKNWWATEGRAKYGKA